MEEFLAKLLNADKLIAWGLFVLAGSFHEWGHAYSAYKLGDPTAKDMGRLSFNPLVHIDLVGTVLLPLFIPSGWLVIGWMKPVPYNPMNLQNQSRDSAIISWGGPFMNFVQAGIAGLVFLALYYFYPQSLFRILSPTKIEKLLPYYLLYSYIGTNILLAFFNLLPVPPLDGGGIIRHFLPQKGKEVIDSLAMYGILFVFLFLYLNKYLPANFQYPYMLPGMFWNNIIAYNWNIIFMLLYFSFLTVNIFFFKRLQKNTLPINSKNIKKEIDKNQDEFNLTKKKNIKLYKLAMSFYKEGDVAALNDILPALKVENANICAPEEYKPEDDYCRKCDWFANCLDRKLANISKQE